MAAKFSSAQNKPGTIAVVDKDELLACITDDDEDDRMLEDAAETAFPSAGKKRGRPRKGTVRDAHLDVRLTRSEKERLEYASADVGMKAADWAREVLLTAADKRQAGLADDIQKLRRDVEQIRNLGQVAERMEKLTETMERAGDLSREVRNAIRVFEAFKNIAEQLGQRRNSE